MIKISKKNISSIYNNMKIAVEQVKVNELLYAESKGILDKFYKDHLYGNAYLCVLHKLGMINSDGIVMSMVNAQNVEPKSFCFELSRANSKFFSSFDNNKVFLYNIIINPAGEIMFEAFQDTRKIYFETFDSNSYKLFLDLPYVLAKIIKDDALSKVRKSMEKFVENNISCTFSNLFNFAKKNLNNVENIFLYYSNLENCMKDNTNARNDISDRFGRIFNSFALKYRNPRKSNYYDRNNVITRYSIEKNEKSEYFLSGDVSDIEYGRSEWLSSFPVKVLIKENEIVPLYLPYDYYINKKICPVCDDNTSILKDDSLLISYDSKIKDYEVFCLSLEPEGRKKYPDKICYSEELDNNLKSVIRHFNKYVKITDAINVNIKGREKIDNAIYSEANLNKSTDILKNLLAQMYRKEVVLNNI